MRRNYQLSIETVEVYQKLYYFHYKPLVKLGLSEGDIRITLAPVLLEFGWSWRQFSDFMNIDLMQRLVFEHSNDLVVAGARTKPMTSRPEYRHYDPNYGALRLKNNALSEDPDRFQ
jgi:hypothetical protein